MMKALYHLSKKLIAARYSKQGCFSRTVSVFLIYVRYTNPLNVSVMDYIQIYKIARDDIYLPVVPTSRFGSNFRSVVPRTPAYYSERCFGEELI